MSTKQTLAALLAIVLGSHSVAADSLPYPPTYFSEYRVQLTVALDVAKNCPDLEIDRQIYDTMAEQQMAKLVQDGFSRENWRAEMQDVPVGLRDRPKVEFYLAWGVRRDDPQSFCRAGRAEIKRGSTIGKLLKPVN